MRPVFPQKAVNTIGNSHCHLLPIILCSYKSILGRIWHISHSRYSYRNLRKEIVQRAVTDKLPTARHNLVSYKLLGIKSIIMVFLLHRTVSDIALHSLCKGFNSSLCIIQIRTLYSHVEFNLRLGSRRSCTTPGVVFKLKVKNI